MTASSPAPPKLIVCDLDQGLLGNQDAQGELLDTWMGWEDVSRPLLLYHSDLPLEELQRSLPTTILPPVNFLIGAGISMLVRFTFWQQIHPVESQQSCQWAGLNPEQLLGVVAARALSELKSTQPDGTLAFPRVQNAVLTASGLCVTFHAAGKSRRPNASVALSWLLNQLNFDAREVRTYVPSDRVPFATRRSQVR